MPNDTATNATWQINSTSEGNKRIRRMTSWEVSDGASVEAFSECGPSDSPVGFVDVPGAKTISFEIRELKTPKREIRWERLKVLKEVFSLTKQIVGGSRVQYPECRVSKIDESGAADQGYVQYTVEIIALRDQPM
ncbi:MAG: hypothetical protein ACTHU0_01385 [Kofleriaceae bacterium]